MRGRAIGSAVVALIVVLALASPAAATTITRRVSVSSTGVESDGNSYHPSVSADGRFVAFLSNATDLVPNDTNGFTDVFVRDRKNHTTTRVSVSSSGTEADGSSYNPSLSADGRYVAFESNATNLVPNDTNGFTDVFIHNLSTETTRRVSVSSAGAQGDGGSYAPALSSDGRFVAFTSDATNLVPNDTNGATDVFVRDRKIGTTRRVSVSSAGTQGGGGSYNPSISADGQFVGFNSYASNLVPNDTNGDSDVFVRDLVNRVTRRVSVSSTGVQGNGPSYNPSVSAHGRFVAFQSSSTNLVPHDTNGFEDIFVRDRKDHTTKRVSLSSTGAQGNGASFLVDPTPVISADGQFVAFISVATNLVPGGTTGEQDFLRNRAAHTTTLLDVSSGGAKGNSSSWDPALTPDGRFVAFPSFSSNLVSNDTNGLADIFLRGPLS